MSKGSTDDITSRKLGMIAEARKAVDSIKDDKPAAEPKRKTVSLEEALKNRNAGQSSSHRPSDSKRNHKPGRTDRGDKKAEEGIGNG